jgi:hypothetical protein
MKHLSIAAVMLAACSAGGEGPELSEETGGQWDDPGVEEWPVDPDAGPGNLHIRESLLGLYGPASMYEDSTGERYVYDDHVGEYGAREQKYTIPEFLGQRRVGTTHAQTPCLIKEGFINLGNTECLLPAVNASYKWRIKDTSKASYVAAARAVIAYYRDSLGVPFVEIPADDESYYLSFEGYRDFGGALVGTTLFDTLGSETITTAGGGQRGIGHFRGRNRVFLDSNITHTKTTLEGTLCHETAHAVGIGHSADLDAATCSLAPIHGLQLKRAERQRLLAVVNGSQGGRVIIPAVQGDDGT